SPPAPLMLVKNIPGVDENGHPIMEAANTQIIGDAPAKPPTPPIEGGYEKSWYNIPAYWALYEIDSQPGKESRNYVTDDSLKTAPAAAVAVAIVAGSTAVRLAAVPVAAAYGMSAIAADAFAGASASSVMYGATGIYEGKKEADPREAAVVIAQGAFFGAAVG